MDAVLILSTIVMVDACYKNCSCSEFVDTLAISFFGCCVEPCLCTLIDGVGCMAVSCDVGLGLMTENVLAHTRNASKRPVELVLLS